VDKLDLITKLGLFRLVNLRIRSGLTSYENTETSYILSLRRPSSPPVVLVDLHLIAIIMRWPIIGLFSLAAAGLVAGNSLHQDVTHMVERQANSSSLNATLLQIFEDIEEATNCNECEACYNCR
jgi:hypothetical protein